MFVNKENINILTSLLVAHGVRRAVVCPGSRNAPIVHNFNECEDIICYPVTDERSAGFYALGMSLADNAPVAVCVTSGTALLNLAPAVAEASYRHHGLIVISADRPQAWIEQLDGQTLPQPGAFGCFTCKSVNLPEPHDDVEKWYCNRLVNEALLAATVRGRQSVHINVPISEPLFDFGTESLPHERKINIIKQSVDIKTFSDVVVRRLLASSRPMFVLGQVDTQAEQIEKLLNVIDKRMAVLTEPLSAGTQRLPDLVLKHIGKAEEYVPDFLLYAGDTVVSKRLKNFLRNMNCKEVWAVAEDEEVHDTFMCLKGVVAGCPSEAVQIIADAVNNENCEQVNISVGTSAKTFACRWNVLMQAVSKLADSYQPAYSQMFAVKEFERALHKVEYPWQTHYANSNAIRLACIYSDRHVWCNRGVNGIEGCLSTAAGFSLAANGVTFCVIGDLSFFYDQNALWNTCIKGNLRILLLNNGCGGIFYTLRGLRDSNAFGTLVSAGHHTTAVGICRQNNIKYIAARNEEELCTGISDLLTAESERPVLLEVFTDAEKDNIVIKEFMKYIG